MPNMSNGIEFSPKTQKLIKHPLVDIETIGSKGFKGKVLEVEVTGYKVEYDSDLEVMYVIPKEILKFSEIGFLTYLEINSSVHSEKTWRFEDENLSSIKDERHHISEGKISLSNVSVEYGEGALTKVVSVSETKGHAALSTRCIRFVVKNDSIYSRHCSGNHNMVHKYNEDNNIILFKKMKLKDKAKNLTHKLDRNVETKYLYDDSFLTKEISYVGNEMGGDVSYAYHDNGVVKSETTTTYLNDIINHKTIHEFDANSNQTAWITERTKPKNFNPIFGEFVPLSVMKARHAQKNDEYGNPLSRESIFYKVENDKSEILLKKEFRSYKYKYHNN